MIYDAEILALRQRLAAVEAGNAPGLLDLISARGPWRDATLFDCAGDGVTDDTSILQEVLTDYGVLYLAPGRTYACTGLTATSLERVLVFGGGCLYLLDGSDAVLLDLAECYYATVAGVELDGNKAGQGAGDWHALQLQNCAYTRVDRAHVHDAKGNGIKLTNHNASTMADEVNFTNSFIFSNGAHGLEMLATGSPQQGPGDQLIANNHINYNGGSGLRLFRNLALIVALNNILTNSAHGIDGEHLYRCIVQGNQSRNNYYAGAYIHGIEGHESQFLGNQFHYNMSAGGGANFDLWEHVRPIVAHNICTDIDFPVRCSYGLQLYNCTDPRIIGNTFQGVLAPTLETNNTRAVWIGNIGRTDSGAGSLTLAAAATTVVAEPLVAAGCSITLTPTNAAAAQLVAGSKSPYISAKTAGTSFTVATADATPAAGTETFDYRVST